MTDRRQVLSFALLGGALLSTTSIVSAPAQQDYPNRTVKMIMPFGAGGPARPRS